MPADIRKNKGFVIPGIKSPPTNVPLNSTPPTLASTASARVMFAELANGRGRLISIVCATLQTMEINYTQDAYSR